MATATRTYFPATDCPTWYISPSTYLPVRWAISTFALGALYKFVPQNYKTLFQVALPLIGLGLVHDSIVVFNRDVATQQSSDFIKNWMTSSCKVLSCVAALFTFPLLVQLTSTPRLNFAQGARCLLVGLISVPGFVMMFFEKQAKDLSQRTSWPEMHDYLVNYPVVLKHKFFSNYGGKCVLFMMAALPVLPTFYNNTHIVTAQFLTPESKMKQLEIFFNDFETIPDKVSEEWEEWTVAAHMLKSIKKYLCSRSLNGRLIAIMNATGEQAFHSILFREYLQHAAHI